MTTMTTGVALAHLLRNLCGPPHLRHSRRPHVELYRGLPNQNPPHPPRHEQGAGFMADGYARGQRRSGVPASSPARG